jgi:hypothetical protein
MAPGWPRIVARSIIGVVLVGLVACERKPAAPAPAPATQAPAAPAAEVAPPPVETAAFAEQPARLAIIPEGHELVDARFSSNGRHVAFVASKEGASWVFHDGQRSAPYERITGLVLDERRNQVAFVAHRGTKQAAVVNGREGTRYATVGKILFAPDGTAVYSARRGDGWVVVVGGRELPVAGEGDPAPVLSPDGTRVVFAAPVPAVGKAALRACSVALLDCQDGQGWDSVTVLASEAPGPRLAFVADKDRKATVAVVDLRQPGLQERTGGWYDFVAIYALSEDGEHLAILARRGDQQLLVRDGVEQPVTGIETPMHMVVSRTGRVLVTTAQQGKVMAIVDGKRFGAGLEELNYPVFGPDGEALAYTAGGATRSVLVVNGEQGPIHDKVVTPRFSPDGRRVVYRARRSGERFVVVADTRGRTIREHPHHDAVFEVTFSPDRKAVGYGVRSGQELWWKVEPL